MSIAVMKQALEALENKRHEYRAVILTFPTTQSCPVGYATLRFLPCGFIRHKK